jgi:altronate dehydratase
MNISKHPHILIILVVGLFDENNRVLRQQMEKQLVDELRDEGYSVVTSFNLMGQNQFKNSLLKRP